MHTKPTNITFFPSEITTACELWN